MEEEGAFHRDTVLSDGSDADDMDELKGLGAVEGPFACQAVGGSKRHFTGHSTTRRPMLFTKTMLRAPARKAGASLRWFDGNTKWRLVVSSKENALEVRCDDGENFHMLFEESVFGCVWDLQPLPLDNIPTVVLEGLQERRKEHWSGLGGCRDLLVASSDAGMLCLLHIDPILSHMRCIDQIPLPVSPKFENVWVGAGCLPAARTFLGHAVRVEERGRAIALAGLEDYLKIVPLSRSNDQSREREREGARSDATRGLRGLGGGGAAGRTGASSSSSSLAAGILPRSGDGIDVGSLKGAIVDAAFVELGGSEKGGGEAEQTVDLAVLLMRKGEGGMASVVVVRGDLGAKTGTVLLSLASASCLLGMHGLPANPDCLLLSSEGCVFLLDLTSAAAAHSAGGGGAAAGMEGASEDADGEIEVVRGDNDRPRTSHPWPCTPIAVPTAANADAAMTDADGKMPELVTSIAWVGVGWGCRPGLCRCGAVQLGAGASLAQGRACEASGGGGGGEGGGASARVLIGMEGGELWVGEVKADRSASGHDQNGAPLSMELRRCEGPPVVCAGIAPLLQDRFFLLRDNGDARVVHLSDSASQGRALSLTRQESISALGPTPDFAVVGGVLLDDGGYRERELAVCSGMGKQSTIRRLRAGSRLQVHGQSAAGDYEGVTGLWGVGWRQRPRPKKKEGWWGQRDATDLNSLLVVSFTNGCRALTVGGELRDVTDEVRLDAHLCSIFVASTREGLFIQVSERSILFVHHPDMFQTDADGQPALALSPSPRRCYWSPPAAASISVACMCENVLLCCTSGGSSMHVIDARADAASSLSVKGEVIRFRAAAEASCMTLIQTSIRDSDAMTENAPDSNIFLAVVGMYGDVDTGRGASVEVMAIDMVECRVVVLQTVELGQYSDGDGAGTVPQSVEGLLVDNRGLHMLVALRNGRVVNMMLDHSGSGLKAALEGAECAMHGLKRDDQREATPPPAPNAVQQSLLLDHATVRRLGECPVSLIRVVAPLGPALMAIVQDRGYLVSPLHSSLRYQRISFPPGGVTHLAPFCCPASPQGMAVVCEGHLYLASIDPTQVLDNSSIPLNPSCSRADSARTVKSASGGEDQEMKEDDGTEEDDGTDKEGGRDDMLAARVVWHAPSKCLVVACNYTGDKSSPKDAGPSAPSCELRVVDEESEQVVCIAPLGVDEKVRCMALFDAWWGETFVCVGTGRARRSGRDQAVHARAANGSIEPGSVLEDTAGAGSHADGGEDGEMEQSARSRGRKSEQHPPLAGSDGGLQGQGGLGRGRREGKGLGPRLTVWRVWRDWESGAVRLRCTASTALKGPCLAVCQYQSYIACSAAERILLLELTKGGSSTPSSPFRLSLVMPGDESDSRNSIGSAPESGGSRSGLNEAGAEWGDALDSGSWALTRAAERVCRMTVTSLAARGTSLVVGDVADAFSLWRVATPLCSGQVVTGSISPEVGCNVLYCANLLADSKSLSVVFRVCPREEAPDSTGVGAAQARSCHAMPASALEGRVSVGTGMEDKEAEVSLLVGFDTPPSPVSYDAILGPMLLKEALLQGELIATQAIELPRACASRREARRKRAFICVISSGGVGTGAMPCSWSLTAYQVHTMDGAALRNSVPQQLECRGAQGAVLVGGHGAVGGGVDRGGDDGSAPGQASSSSAGTSKTIILYGSAGQSALVYVGNPEQQPGQQQTARPDQHVGLHHTFGESAQVDEQVVLKVRGWTEDSILTVSVRGSRESELMSLPMTGDIPDGVILQAPHSEELVFFRMWGDGASRAAVSGIAWGEEGSGLLGVDATGHLHVLHHEQPSPHGRLPSKAIMAGANVLAASHISLGESSWVLREGSLLCPHQNLAAEQQQLLESQSSLPSRPHVALAMSFQGTLVAVLGLHEGEGTEELLKLQAHLLKDPATAPVLGHSHRQYRGGPIPMRGVLDGDLLNSFLELTLEQQARLSKDAGARLNPRQLCELIDALNNLVA